VNSAFIPEQPFPHSVFSTDAGVHCWCQWAQRWCVWGCRVSEASGTGRWLQDWCWSQRSAWFDLKVLPDLAWSWWTLLLHSSISFKTFRERS